MKRNVLRVLTGLSAILILLAAADTASAQRRETRGRQLTKSQVKVIINRVETRVDYFVKNFDRLLDRSHLDGTNKEDWLNKRAKDLEKATDELRREFDRRDVWRENKDEVSRCITIAKDINQNIRKNRYGALTESNWAKVRYELNTLADVYNLRRV